jgi:hypothetical protein
LLDKELNATVPKESLMVATIVRDVHTVKSKIQTDQTNATLHDVTESSKSFLVLMKIPVDCVRFAHNQIPCQMKQELNALPDQLLVAIALKEDPLIECHA